MQLAAFHLTAQEFKRQVSIEVHGNAGLDRDIQEKASFAALRKSPTLLTSFFGRLQR
jgi:hypothetical protein